MAAVELRGWMALGCVLGLAMNAASSAAPRLGRPTPSSNELKNAAERARKVLQTHGNIEFFTRDEHGNWTLIEPSSSGTSPKSAHSQEADQPKPEVLCIATKPDQSIQSWVFPLGNDLTELIERASGYGVIDTKSPNWKAIVEKKFKAGKSLVEEVNIPDHDGRIIDRGESVSITARRRDEPTPLPWKFAAKNLRDLTSFDFERVLQPQAAYDPNELLPELDVLADWPEKGMHHPAFFKKQLKELANLLDNPKTTISELGEAFKRLNDTYSVSVHSGSKHWLANVRWDWAFDTWWHDKAIERYKGEAPTIFLVENAATMPYREVLSITGVRLPWLDELVTKVAELKDKWRAFDVEIADTLDSPRRAARRQFNVLWNIYERYVPEHKKTVVTGFRKLLADDTTTVEQLVDFILTADSLQNDKVGRRILSRARTFDHWLAAGEGTRGHTHWLSADYVATHRNTKTLFELEHRVSNVRVLVDDLIAAMLHWIRLGDQKVMGTVFENQRNSVPTKAKSNGDGLRKPEELRAN